eukprot:NODE_974_length_1783_cov_49.371396_g100_i1.p1 GENE.NODE_974_length_1783_cov_49.371396_g100_i1~~NODE_974_length_1783_cov_49.371396_g100_i1.p1  ORF type:complete len:423 (-),score=20.51 NODE_974_length_1783_cov_49.371396_g100_i1:426-1694(-)
MPRDWCLRASNFDLRDREKKSLKRNLTIPALSDRAATPAAVQRFPSHYPEVKSAVADLISSRIPLQRQTSGGTNLPLPQSACIPEGVVEDVQRHFNAPDKPVTTGGCSIYVIETPTPGGAPAYVCIVPPRLSDQESAGSPPETVVASTLREAPTPFLISVGSASAPQFPGESELDQVEKTLGHRRSGGGGAFTERHYALAPTTKTTTPCFQSNAEELNSRDEKIVRTHSTFVLAPGWRSVTTPDGRKCYLHQDSDRCEWTVPESLLPTTREEVPQRHPFSGEVVTPPWRVVKTPDGLLCYVYSRRVQAYWALPRSWKGAQGSQEHVDARKQRVQYDREEIAARFHNFPLRILDKPQDCARKLSASPRLRSRSSGTRYSKTENLRSKTPFFQPRRAQQAPPILPCTRGPSRPAGLRTHRCHSG